MVSVSLVGGRIKFAFLRQYMMAKAASCFVQINFLLTPFHTTFSKKKERGKNCMKIDITLHQPPDSLIYHSSERHNNDGRCSPVHYALQGEKC